MKNYVYRYASDDSIWVTAVNHNGNCEESNGKDLSSNLDPHREVCIICLTINFIVDDCVAPVSEQHAKVQTAESCFLRYVLPIKALTLSETAHNKKIHLKSTFLQLIERIIKGLTII